MEQLIKEIEAFAALRGVKPGTVLQWAGGFGGKVWGNWVAGTASCTLPMADRIRRYMASNWPEGHEVPAHLLPYAAPSAAPGDAPAASDPTEKDAA